MGCCGGPKTGKEFDFDHEGPSEEDMCRFGSDAARCESCKAEIYDEATICPACGHAQGAGGAGTKRWVLVVALITFIAVLAWIGLPLI